MGGSILILELIYGPVVLVCIMTESTKIAWHRHVACSNVTLVGSACRLLKAELQGIGWILVFRILPIIKFCFSVTNNNSDFVTKVFL